MNIIPVELLTMIATSDFNTFMSLLRVPTIGNRLCEQYPQLIAKERFVRIVITAGGKTKTYLGGKLHSFSDQPAVKSTSISRWYWHGEKHRGGDLPAVVYPTDDKFWYRYDKLHRDGDLPAIVYCSGNKHWYWNDERHRGYDKPAIEWSNGDKWWYRYDKLVHMEKNVSN